MLPMWIVKWILSVLTIFRIFTDASSNNGRQSRFTPPQVTCNALTYVYVVGVEGVGHHGVSPAIARIAKTCNQHVLYELRNLRTHQHKKSSDGFKLQLSKLGSMQYSTSDVVIIEDSSFPNAHILRNATHEQLKSSGHYDLEWIHKEMLNNFPHLKVKYLHLSRDFYRTVASHPEFDGGFERHAQVLHSFMWHINSEYEKISKRQQDAWRQINYEWFTNMDTYNCTAIVSAIIDFMEWNHCDVEFACKTLHETVHKERRKTVNPIDYAYAQTFNTKLSIPELDITPNKTYKFTTVVSKRLPIDIRSDSVDRPGAKRTEDGPFKRESVRSSLSGPLGGKDNVRDAQRLFYVQKKRQCAPGVGVT